MTKKLEQLFDLPADLGPGSSDSSVKVLHDTEVSLQAKQEIQEQRNIIAQVDDAIDKIDIALPTVRDLEASDQEMDELASNASKSFDDLMDLGMNVDSRWASDIFSVASTMLGHAITAKTAKLNKKLKMVDLQLKKANLDAKQVNNEDIATGTGVVLDRNALLDRLLGKTNEEK